MSGLARTDLATPRKIQLAASAVARQGEHGAVSALSRDFGVCRRTVDRARDIGADALSASFAVSTAKTVAVDDALLRRAIVALRMTGRCTVRGIVDLVSTLYPGMTTSYGAVQSVLSLAENNAATFNASMRLDAVGHVALDELFSQGDPILGGVDLDCGLAVALSKRSSRSSMDWQDVLQSAKRQGMSLTSAVRDGAAGIAHAVGEVWPEAEQRDDCFHALYAMTRCRGHLERRAFALMSAIDGFDRDIAAALAKAKPNACRVANLRDERRKAQAKLNKAMDVHDDFEVAMRQVRAALELIDMHSGQLRTRDDMRTALIAAAQRMAAMSGKAGKAGRYILKRVDGLTSYVIPTTERIEALQAEHGEDPVMLALVIQHLVTLLRARPYGRERRDTERHLAGAFAALRRNPKADEILEAVEAILLTRHRASSAIEGFNATLRPYLYLQKRATPGFLSLFQAWYNLRPRRWGRFAGTTAYGLATGTNVEDWLTVLGFPPNTLAA